MAACDGGRIGSGDDGTAFQTRTCRPLDSAAGGAVFGGSFAANGPREHRFALVLVVAVVASVAEFVAGADMGSVHPPPNGPAEGFWVNTASDLTSEGPSHFQPHSDLAE